jgi:hypothetical protein
MQGQDELTAREAGDGARLVGAVAERTLKVSCAVRATRNVPSEVWRIAADPTDARAPAGSIDTETVRPFTVPETALSGVAFDGEVRPSAAGGE